MPTGADNEVDALGRVEAARSTASRARFRLNALSNDVLPSWISATLVFCSERVGAVDIVLVVQNVAIDAGWWKEVMFNSEHKSEQRLRRRLSLAHNPSAFIAAIASPDLQIEDFPVADCGDGQAKKISVGTTWYLRIPSAIQGHLTGGSYKSFHQLKLSESVKALLFFLSASSYRNMITSRSLPLLALFPASGID